MSFAKSDGAKIKITFDQAITGASGNQSHFTVTVPEYNYVPNGTLRDVIKAVKATSGYVGLQETVDLASGTPNNTVLTSSKVSLAATGYGSIIYYNGVELPPLPVVDGHPYVFIRKNISGGFYHLIFTAERVYYLASDSALAGVTNTSAYNAVWYSCPIGGVAWEYVNTANTWFGVEDNRVVIWSNTDIPNGSATSTNIWLAGSEPTPNAIYATSGAAIYAKTNITGTVSASTISWTENAPTGTSVMVKISTDNTTWTAVTNGGAALPIGTALNNATLYIKVELATTDASVTPSVSNLQLSLQSADDRKSIVLEMEPLQRFESAAGNITVAYDGAGTLAGEAGNVETFSTSFAPTDLAPKPDQNDEEHIEIRNITATGVLTKINYKDAQSGGEHIEIMGITATGVLTHINDI